MNKAIQDDDLVVDELVSVFARAQQLLRERKLSGKNVTMEMDAMDLLMDYALLLGPYRLADVLLLLSEEQSERELITHSQVVSAIDSVSAAPSWLQRKRQSDD
jgi:hypothetical protein